MSSVSPASPAEDPPEAPGPVRLLGLASAVPGALIVVLTFADVFGRYLFSSPIRGSVEIIEFAMALLIFSALPVVTRQRGHVSVGLLDGLLSPRWRSVQTTACDLVSAIALALMTWRLGVQALRDFGAGEATMILGLSRAALGFAMTALAAVSTLFALMLAWKSLTGREDRS